MTDEARFSVSFFRKLKPRSPETEDLHLALNDYVDLRYSFFQSYTNKWDTSSTPVTIKISLAATNLPICLLMT